MHVLLIIILIIVLFFIFKNQRQENTDENMELFSTDNYEEKESVKSAKCPQCGRTAVSYKDVKENFGLRKVGNTTDIQSWCRECRRDKDEIKEKQSLDNDLGLFDE